MYVCWYPYGGQPVNDLLVPYPPEPTVPTYPIPAALPPVICRKRGSEELMSHSPMVTNGTAVSPQYINNGSDMSNDNAKKVKLDPNDAGQPSRVVHIRSLPTECTEADIVHLGMPFGKMSNVLLLKQKNQAFLEFAEENAAITLVNYYSSIQAQVRTKPVYVQFSNHKTLKTDASHALQNTTAQAALQTAQTLMLANSEESGKTILRIIVEHMAYPVTLDVLHMIFSKYGKILKMIIFTKNNTFQALIQFGDAVAAGTAKMSLEGQNIYNGCCTLRVDYSKLNNLNVKFNNDKSRDFTNPNLPTGDGPMEHMGMPFPGQMHPQGMFPQGAAGMLASPFGPGFAPTALTAFGGSAAGGLGGMPAGMQAMQMPGMPGFNLPPPMTAAGQIAGMPMAPQGNTVMLVSNLDEETVTPDALFTLFGVYGDVHRVKILFNKKDNALIQMAEPRQAQIAIAYLDKVLVWGKPIRVTQSKHSQVQMPKEGQPDAGLTKDFTNSPLHRFKRPGSKNCQNIYPPSAVLHLSNIPATVTEESIKELFSEHGEVIGFKFFPKDRKMALIQMSTVDEAVLALIAMHNYQLSDSSHLRVSFSKSTI